MLQTVHLQLPGSHSFTSVDVPDDCTVGHWKRLLGQGFLGDKILYATKLTCREVERGRQLEDASPLPAPPCKMYIDGPGSVVKMLELALKKQFGGPTPLVEVPLPRPAGWDASPVSLLPDRSPPPFGSPLLDVAARAVSAPLPLRSTGSNNHFLYVCAGLQGMRPHMEDRTLGILELPGHEHAALFGVFDGHGGHEVAELAVQLLPRILSCALNEAKDPAEALKIAFDQLDEEIMDSARQRGAPRCFHRVGSTAVVALLLREAGRLRLLCANCGDSRAVLCRSGRSVDLSVDQKPHNPKEKRRIEAAGGRVELFGPCWRIDAGLNLSRALGDFGYKANPDKCLGEQKVISEPEIKEIIIKPEDQFFAMGSDGVFDILSSEALVRHLRDAQQHCDSWADAVDSALSRSLPGGDNVSLCLVQFLHDKSR